MLTKGRVFQLLIMLCLLIYLVLWKTINAPLEEESRLADILTVEQTLCDFTSSCIFKSRLGEFNLSVDEGSVKADQWFNFRLQSNVNSWQVESAKIVGKSMFMGEIPVKFSNVLAQQSTAKTMLASCTKTNMIWQLKINIMVDEQSTQLIYDFPISDKE